MSGSNYKYGTAWYGYEVPFARFDSTEFDVDEEDLPMAWEIFLKHQNKTDQKRLASVDITVDMHEKE